MKEIEKKIQGLKDIPIPSSLKDGRSRDRLFQRVQSNVSEREEELSHLSLSTVQEMRSRLLARIRANTGRSYFAHFFSGFF